MGSRERVAMLRLLLFVGVVCCANGQNMASQYSVVADQMSQLLRIRQQINMDFSPFALAPHHLAHEVRSLGDGADSSSPKVDAHSNTAALLRLDRVITQYQQQAGSDLGEAQADSKVDLNKLNQLMDAADGDDATGVVDRLAAFLAKSSTVCASFTLIRLLIPLHAMVTRIVHTASTMSQSDEAMRLLRGSIWMCRMK